MNGSTKLTKVYYIPYLQPWHFLVLCGMYLGKVLYEDSFIDEAGVFQDRSPFRPKYMSYQGEKESYLGPNEEHRLFFDDYNGFSPGCNIAGKRNESDPF